MAFYAVPLFPRGFAFETGDTALVYDPARPGRADAGRRLRRFRHRRAAAHLHEALANDHPTNLGITMFVRLLPKIDPRKLYGLFILFRLDDDGHMRRSRALFAGLAHDGLRRSFPMPPPLPE